MILCDKCNEYTRSKYAAKTMLETADSPALFSALREAMANRRNNHRDHLLNEHTHSELVEKILGR